VSCIVFFIVGGWVTSLTYEWTGRTVPGLALLFFLASLFVSPIGSALALGDFIRGLVKRNKLVIYMSLSAFIANTVLMLMLCFDLFGFKTWFVDWTAMLSAYASH
jgi:hypothetical protein